MLPSGAFVASSHAMIPSAGQQIGSVVLQQVLATGGMGCIWVAEHTLLQRQVAVKFLPTGEMHAAAALRLEHEGRTMAQIRSPYVPEIFEYGCSADGSPFVVMELLAGAHLGAWVERYGRLDVEEVAQVLEQVGLALTAAHEIGVVHRDVKPENVILNGRRHNFTAKLIDFGIAKSADSSRKSVPLTLVGFTIGSTGYMSPEQLEGSPDVDGRSDIWSLAVVAYRCLTGRLPFEAPTFDATSIAVNRGHFRPVSELRSELSPSLDRWFDKALAPDVAHRIQETSVMGRMFRVAAFSDPNQVLSARGRLQVRSSRVTAAAAGG